MLERIEYNAIFRRLGPRDDAANRPGRSQKRKDVEALRQRLAAPAPFLSLNGSMTSSHSCKVPLEVNNRGAKPM